MCKSWKVKNYTEEHLSCNVGEQKSIWNLGTHKTIFINQTPNADTRMITCVHIIHGGMEEVQKQSQIQGNFNREE